ncbi:hypothetical protein [Endozoicomonas lisbonensis]|uniref:Large polyvalent protein-associated domain-containing protein n=1 Tax=Endozoicomonas lisbonensis TaxID=3120522 RepID=A0ABV2SHL8_9GAMM
MLGIPANLIQQAERFTQKYNDDQVLRLRNGKIVAGEFKGTGSQKFKGMLVKLFWPPTSWKRKFLDARQAKFEEISKQEEQAFARALAGAISKRTTRPYKAVSSLMVVDVKALLKDSQTEREAFDQTIARITDAVTHPSEMVGDPLDGAKKVADMAVDSKQICRVTQMQELRSGVTEILSQAGIKKATIERLDKALDDQTVKLALYNVACEYARRIYSPPTSWSSSSPSEENAPVPRTPSEEQEEDWSRKREMADTPHQDSFKYQSPAELAVDQMFEEGEQAIDRADVPEGKHITRKIRELQRINEPWAKQAIELLNSESPEDHKKAILLERVHLRSKDHAKLQKEKAGAVQQTQTAYWSRSRLKAMQKVEKLEGRGITDNSHFPQEYRDLAAQRISRPLYYDNVQLPMGEAIEQTITMLKNAYPSLAAKGNAFREQELREHLENFLSQRKIEPVEVPFRTFSASTQTGEDETDDVSFSRHEPLRKPVQKPSGGSTSSSWHPTEPPPLDNE